MTREGGEQPFEWGPLVPLLIHPIKVGIVEALWKGGKPLSATELTRGFFKGELGLANVSYHLTQLAKRGALEKVGERQVRGARENFYFFAPQK